MTDTVADPKTVAEAAALLRAGRLCAFPTETVYGLGADATNARFVAEALTREAFHNVSYFRGSFAEAQSALTQ